MSTTVSRSASPVIVLPWITRLRWLAIAGQLFATVVAAVMGLQPPLVPLLIVIFVTAATNAFLTVRPITWRLVVPAVLLLDVGSLTLLLYYTGGPANPFCTLYLVHVAMAVVVLDRAWTWLIVAAAAVAYASLFVASVPLSPGQPMSQRTHDVGAWTGLVLVGALIAYFAGRLTRSLRAHEDELVELRETAARNERLGTLTTLAAGAAHELGSPLATIAVAAKELERDAKAAGQTGMAEDAQLIRQECDRCRFILDRMRVDIADGQGTPARVSELIEQFKSHLVDDERTRLRCEVAQDNLSVAASALAVQQAVVVMIRNAFDASPAGATVKLIGRADGAKYLFEVHDTGHGMTEEVARRAGEPFFTTKEPGHGMGLGLFLVRLVAERAQGSFSLKSKPGSGTASTLALPLTK